MKTIESSGLKAEEPSVHLADNHGNLLFLKLAAPTSETILFFCTVPQWLVQTVAFNSSYIGEVGCTNGVYGYVPLCIPMSNADWSQGS